MDSRPTNRGQGSEPTGRFQKGCHVTLLQRKASPREEAGKEVGLRVPAWGGSLQGTRIWNCFKGESPRCLHQVPGQQRNGTL